MENTEATPPKKGMSPMMIGSIIILVIVVIGAIVFMTKGGSKSVSQTSSAPTAAPTQAAQQPAEGSAMEEKKEGAIKTFEIDASNFKFTPNTITVNEGDTVKITFKNTQGFHDFVLDEYNVKSKTIPADQTEEIQFVASKKGTFEYYCSVGNHRAMGMTGKLTVN